MRTVWLSFCDSSLPKGSQFLGVAIVDVTDEDIREAAWEVALLFPQASDGSDVIAAAVKKAHATGCNPGGEVQLADITDTADPVILARAPRHQLLSKAELAALKNDAPPERAAL